MAIDVSREAITRFVHAKRAKEVAEERFSEAQQDLLDVLGDQKSAWANVDDMRVTVTQVEQSRVVIDESRLKKCLGAPVFNKITKRVLDKELLQDAITRKEVDPVKVAQCSEEIRSRPFIRMSAKVIKTRRKSA